MMTLTTNKAIEFDKLIPDFKRFALKVGKEMTNKQLVLQYAYYDGQYLIATDSHRLIRVNADYITNLPSNEPFLYDMKNKKIVTDHELNYPNVNRMIPEHSNTTIEITNNNLKEIRNSLDELLVHVKGQVNNVISLDIKSEKQQLILSDQANTIEIAHDCIINGNDTKLHVNCKYMKDALMSVSKLNKLTEGSPVLNIVSKLRPIQIKASNVYDIVVMPMRIY